MNQTQYDCVICLTSFDKKEDIKQLCKNSKDHIMCNDCYLDILTRVIIEKKDVQCPYCRHKIQKLKDIDLSLQTIINPPTLSMKNGKLHGKCIYYYLNRSIMESIEYINGKKHGHHITYYVNGFVKSDFNYFNGKINGKVLLYYEDGKKHKIMNYKKGLLDGEYKEYDIDGTLLLKWYHYKDNKKNGLCIDLEFTELKYPYYDYRRNVYITHHYEEVKRNYINDEIIKDKKIKSN